MSTNHRTTRTRVRSKKTGSLSLTADKATFKARLSAHPDDPIGRPKRSVKRESGESLSDFRKRAEAALAELDAERSKRIAAKDADYAERDNPTIASFADRWLAEMGDVTDATRADYERVLRHYVLPEVGRIGVADLTARDVLAMDRALAKRRRRGASADDESGFLSPTTRRRARGALRTLMTYAVEEQLVAVNPVAGVRPIRARKHASAEKVLDTGELRDLLGAAADERLGIFVVAAAHTGARRGELLALSWSDVSKDMSALTIRSAVQTIARPGRPTEYRIADPKTETSRRKIPVTPALAEALRAWRARQSAERLAAGPLWADTGLVFTDEIGQMLKPSPIRSLFARITKEAGLTKVTPHWMRHTAASLMLAAGESVPDVAKALGHATPAVTMSVYAHVINDGADKAIGALGEALSGSVGQ